MKYKNGQMTNSLAKLLIYMPTPGRVGQLTILKFHDIHCPHFLSTDCYFLWISNKETVLDHSLGTLQNHLWIFWSKY